LSEEKKKKEYYYYGGKEKKAGEIKKRPEEEVMLYTPGAMLRDFDRLMSRFERDFEDFWGASTRFGRDMASRARSTMMPFTGIPSVDIEDQGKDYRLTVDLPGFKKEDVQVELTEDSVTVNAKKTYAEDEQRKNYVRRERAAQTYYRRIPLPERIRSDDAKANLNNGILEITLPKKEPKEIKKLPIT
jgi:HSP20 family protein